jgi:hypothetical protein
VRLREPAAVALAALIGAAFWIWIAGLRVIDSREVGCLMRSDWQWHFLGWHFFRHDGWHLPPGRIALWNRRLDAQGWLVLLALVSGVAPSLVYHFRLRNMVPFPFATAYLRRPIVQQTDRGQLFPVGTTDWRAEGLLLARWPFVYAFYDALDRDCASEPVPLGRWANLTSLGVCRVPTRTPVLTPQALFGDKFHQ